MQDNLDQLKALLNATLQFIFGDRYQKANT